HRGTLLANGNLESDPQLKFSGAIDSGKNKIPDIPEFLNIPLLKSEESKRLGKILTSMDVLMLFEDHKNYPNFYYLIPPHEQLTSSLFLKDSAFKLTPTTVIKRLVDEGYLKITTKNRNSGVPMYRVDTTQKAKALWDPKFVKSTFQPDVEKVPPLSPEEERNVKLMKEYEKEISLLSQPIVTDKNQYVGETPPTYIDVLKFFLQEYPFRQNRDPKLPQENQLLIKYSRLKKQTAVNVMKTLFDTGLLENRRIEMIHYIKRINPNILTYEPTPQLYEVRPTERGMQALSLLQYQQSVTQAAQDTQAACVKDEREWLYQQYDTQAAQDTQAACVKDEREWLYQQPVSQSVQNTSKLISPEISEPSKIKPTSLFKTPSLKRIDPEDALLSQVVLNEPFSNGCVGPIMLLQMLKFCQDSMNQHDRTSLLPSKQLVSELGFPESAYIREPDEIIEKLQQEDLIKFNKQASVGGGYYYWKELLPKGRSILEKYFSADVASHSALNPSKNNEAMIHPDEQAFEPMKVAKENHEKLKKMIHAYQAAQNIVKPSPSGLTGWDLIQTIQEEIALRDASRKNKFSFKFWRKSPLPPSTILKAPYTSSLIEYNRDKLYQKMKQKFPLLTRDELFHKLSDLFQNILPPLFPNEPHWASAYPHEFFDMEIFRAHQSESLPDFLKKSHIRENNPQDVAAFIKTEIEAVQLEMADQKIKLERLEQQLLQRLQQDPETSLKFQEMSLALRKTCLALDEERLKTQDVDKHEELTRELTESLHQVDLLDLQGKYSKSQQDAFTRLLKNTQKQYRLFVEKSTQRLIQLNSALKKCEHLQLTQDLKDPQISTALEKTMLNLLLSQPASPQDFSETLLNDAQAEADRLLEQKKQDDILLVKIHQLKTLTTVSSSSKE
ncbi:MAG: hypothetical protein K2X66_04740, partial [Cyanobacteria bacterium]|nr:hypothetical protein [Cyanobacteriota bacterium]